MRMKKSFLFLSCALALCILTACGAASSAAMPNSMKTVESANAFADLKITMEAPNDATEVQHFIVSDTLAHIAFTLNDHAYILRGSAVESDISGVYEEFTPDVRGIVACGINESFSIDVKTSKEGGQLASWVSGDVNHTLWCGEKMSADDFDAVALTCAEKTVASS